MPEELQCCVKCKKPTLVFEDYILKRLVNYYVVRDMITIDSNDVSKYTEYYCVCEECHLSKCSNN